jgi:hypothetical protein
MQWNVTSDGLVLEGAGGRVRVGPCRPALLVDTGAGPTWWRPETVRVDEGRLMAGPGPSGVVVEVDTAPLADYFAERVDLFCRVRNTGSSPVHVHRLVLLSTDSLTVGADSRRWRTYRNGFQSWAGTMTIGTDERAWGQAWHVPSAPAVSQRDAVQALAKAAGTTVQVGSVPNLALTVGGLFNPSLKALKEVLYQFDKPWIIDASLTEQTFGLAATPLAEGAAATVAWWRQRLAA